MKYRSLIIEDEEKSRNRLKRLLKKCADVIDVVGEAADGNTAIEKINELKPDLLFCDISLPGKDAFEVLQQLQVQPLIIFTTAYDKHALDAWGTNAIDFLLKPIDFDALQRALAKLQKMRPPGELDLAQTITALKKSSSYLSRVICKVGNKYFPVGLGDVVYFQSDNKYTCVHTNGKNFLIDMPLVDLQEKLDPNQFVRIHRKTIVNMAWISEIEKWFNGKCRVVVRDRDLTKLEASRMYASQLKGF